MPSAEAIKWINAGKEETEALHENKTWTLTKLPPGKKECQKVHIVFQTETRNKWRSGVLQSKTCCKRVPTEYGEEFDETFASVVKVSTIRMLLSVANSRKKEVKHLDVKTVFLQGKLLLKF